MQLVAISQNPCANDAVSCQAWSQSIYAMTLGISWHLLAFWFDFLGGGCAVIFAARGSAWPCTWQVS